MDENICWRWCCYSDEKKCDKIVTKNNKNVRCKRNGIYFCKKKKKYYCEKHIQHCSDKIVKLDSKHITCCCEC